MATEPAARSSTDESPLPVLLTLTEVADTLRCSEKTILRRIAAGTLPATKQGGRWLFTAADIKRALIAGMARTKLTVSGVSSALDALTQTTTDHQP